METKSSRIKSTLKTLLEEETTFGGVVTDFISNVAKTCFDADEYVPVFANEMLHNEDYRQKCNIEDVLRRRKDSPTALAVLAVKDLIESTANVMANGEYDALRLTEELSIERSFEALNLSEFDRDCIQAIIERTKLKTSEEAIRYALVFASLLLE